MRNYIKMRLIIKMKDEKVIVFLIQTKNNHKSNVRIRLRPIK